MGPPTASAGTVVAMVVLLTTLKAAVTLLVNLTPVTLPPLVKLTPVTHRVTYIASLRADVANGRAGVTRRDGEVTVRNVEEDVPDGFDFDASCRTNNVGRSNWYRSYAPCRILSRLLYRNIGVPSRAPVFSQTLFFVSTLRRTV
jgi:hypothetical protein